MAATGHNIRTTSDTISFRDQTTGMASISFDHATETLTISHDGTGVIAFGDTSSDIFLGDGVTSVDLIMEVDGAIKGDTDVTLTLGSTDSDILIASPTVVNNNFDITGTLDVTGDITMGGETVLTGITSGDITGALGYTPLSSETDDQTLDEVLAQGNTSTRDISVGAITGSALTIDTDTLFVDATNNRVGIGTTSPSTPLEIEQSGGAASIKLKRSDTSDSLLLLEGSSYGYLQNTTGPLGLGGTNSNSDIYILANGDVGIGTTTPQTPLHVQDSGGTGIRVSRSGYSAYAQLYPAYSSVPTLMGRGAGGLHLGYESNTAGIRIDTSNNVGIGTTSPATVGGTAKLTIDVGATTNVPVTIANGTTDALYIRRHASSGKYQLQTTVGASNIGDLALQGYGGNVGIGEVNPTTKLYVAGTFRVTGDATFNSDLLLGGYQSGTVSTSMPAFEGGFTITTPESADMQGNAYFMSDLAYFNKKGGTVTATGLTTSPTWDTLFRPDASIVGISSSSYSGSTFTLELSDVDHVKNLRYGTYCGIIFGASSFKPSSLVIEWSTDDGSSYTTALNSSASEYYYYTRLSNSSSAITNIKFTIGLPAYSSIRIANIFATDYAGDGISEYFVPSDGGTYYGDVLFRDSKVLKFGNSSDLQIYHDGSNSWISEVGTGSLITAADNFYLRNAAGNETKISAISNGAVELYHDNSKKLETTSSGITVTGTTTSSNLTLTGLSSQASEATALMINGSNVVGTRELGSNAFTSTTIPSAANDATITLSGGTEITTSIGSFTTDQSSNETLTINHANVSRSDTTSTASPAFGATFTVVDEVTSNARGHVTAENVKTITLPSLGTTSTTALAGNTTVDDVSEANLKSRLAALDSTDTLYIGDAGDDTTVVIRGTLQVDGTTTTVNSTTLTVDDKNIELGSVASPTDSTADGGGITLKGATDKTLTWVDSTDSWTSNQTFSAPNLTLTSLSNQSSEATALVINGSNVVGYRELGSNAFTSTTIPTNNNQLTNGAGYITSFDITTQTDSKYLRSDADDVTTGNLDIQSSDGSKTLRVGNVSSDNYAQVAQYLSSSVRGFTNQYSNASVLENLQGTTNQHIVLGDVQNGNANTLFGVSITQSGTTYPKLTLSGAGNATFAGSVTATSLIKSGGTSSEFLKADGSVDSNTYLTSETDTLATVIGRGSTTTSAITLGPSSVSGGRMLSQSYSGNSRLGVLSSYYGSGALVLGYGAEGKSGSAGYVSTYSNFSGGHSALKVANQTLTWSVDASNSQTAIGSDLTLNEEFKVDRSGVLTMGDGFTSTKGNTAYGWGDHASAGYASSSHNHTLDSLSNVTITSNASGEILKWNGSAWVNNTLSEAGICPTAGSTSLTTVGTISTGTWNGSVIASAYLDADTAHLSGNQTFSGVKTFSARPAFSSGMDVLNSIRRSGDTNTYIDFGTTDLLHFYAGGIKMLSLIESASNEVVFNDGGVDVDFRVEANGEANALFVQGSNGSVGIGTASPFAKLDVAGNTDTTVFLGRTKIGSYVTDYMYISHYDYGTSSNYALKQAPAGSTALNAPTGQSVSLGINNSTKLIVNSSGNVGIGTTSPSSRLEINPTATYDGITIKGNIVPRVVFNGTNSGSNHWGVGIHDNNGNQFAIGHNTTGHAAMSDYLVIDVAGNVGIGTTSPDVKLHVGSGSGATGDSGYQIVADSAGIAGVQILAATNQSSRVVFGDSGDNDIGMIKYDHTNDSLSFRTNATDGRLIIDSSGRVGIGTTSPSYPLHVSVSGDNGVRIDSDSHASLYVNSASSTSQYIRFSENNSAKYWIQSSSGLLRFRSSGTSTVANQVIFDSSGRVGIGVMPSSAELEVNGHFMATTKSFIIDNPKTGGKLQYGVVESDQHSVLVRGKNDTHEIELPEEWEWLVDPDSVTVDLTSVGQIQQLFVISQDNKKIKIGGLAINGQYNYTVYGERVDVDKLQVNV